MTLANNLKRFIGWLESFNYDKAAVKDDLKPPKEQSDDWRRDRSVAAELEVEKNGPVSTVLEGMRVTFFPSVTNTKNSEHVSTGGWFTSPDAEKLDRQEKKQLEKEEREKTALM